MNELKVDKEKTTREKQVMERRTMLRRQGRVAGGHFDLVKLVRVVGAFRLLENQMLREGQSLYSLPRILGSIITFGNRIG